LLALAFLVIFIAISFVFKGLRFLILIIRLKISFIHKKKEKKYGKSFSIGWGDRGAILFGGAIAYCVAQPFRAVGKSHC
jgi:hypothetical protein